MHASGQLKWHLLCIGWDCGGSYHLVVSSHVLAWTSVTLPKEQFYMG
jgi:hypothetical protein